MHHILTLKTLEAQAETLDENHPLLQECARSLGVSAHSLLQRVRAMQSGSLEKRPGGRYQGWAPLGYVALPQAEGFVRRDGWTAGSLDADGAAKAVPDHQRPGSLAFDGKTEDDVVREQAAAAGLRYRQTKMP